MPITSAPQQARVFRQIAQRKLAATAKGTLGAREGPLAALAAMQQAQGLLQGEAGLLSQTSSITRPEVSRRGPARLGPVIGPRQPRPVARRSREPVATPVSRRHMIGTPSGDPGKNARQRLRKMRRRLLGGF